MNDYTSRRRGDATRLLIAGERPVAASLADIEKFLRPGDLIVVNESGTLPASLPVTLERTGESFELRLAARVGGDSDWLAVTFGSGSWRDPTEARGAPPRLWAGDKARISEKLAACVTEMDPRHSRLLRLRFEGDLAEIYLFGEPVQYSYHRDPLNLWDAQTPLASLPWSVEAPSALFSLTFARLFELRKQHEVVPLVHGAGLSSTGEETLDSLFPLPEPYRIPESTIHAVREAKRSGRRILAWGTTVARALEGSFEMGAAEGTATLRLGRDRPARIVDGIVTGFHEPGTSHYALEEAFVSRERLERSYRAGKSAGLIGHEYGDLMLLWREDASAV